MRKKLVLLTAYFSNPLKDLVAATLGWMCQDQGLLFEVYYASERSDGGIFSPHGALVLGGRHHATLGRVLAQYEVTLVRLDALDVLQTLLERGASEIIDYRGSLIDFYAALAGHLGLNFPIEAVLIQQNGLPEGITQGISRLVPSPEGHRLAEDLSYPRQPAVARYTFPEITRRRAIGLPLETGPAEIERAKTSGTCQTWLVGLADADVSAWQAAGLAPASAETLDPAETWQTLTFRLAQKWAAQASGFDLCEPILASTWLPYAIRENRLMVHGDIMQTAAEALAPLAKAKNQAVVFGRYGGGSNRGARSDEELFPLFKNNISFEVVEPGRPLVTVFSCDPQPLPQPKQSLYDLEPSDAELIAWLEEGKIPVTMIFHSGEMSHDDGMINIMDLSAATGVKVGLGVHYQRYWFSPEAVEPMHTPLDQGGVMGLVEPLLHSSGLGIVAESLGDAAVIAGQMAEARAKIVAAAGERFAPRGVYPYLDVLPRQWQDHNLGLWDAIADQGFEYLISSSSQSNDPAILYERGRFAVLNQDGKCHYPYSPFFRIDVADDLLAHERYLIQRGGAGWMMPVLDCPIYAYSSYLSIGDPFARRDGLGQFYRYILKGGESGRMVSATPHTIVRFAKLAKSWKK